MMIRGSLTSQILVMVFSVGVVSATLTWTLVMGSLDAVVGSMEPQLEDRVRVALGVAVGISMLCTTLAAIGAVAFLRSSIRGAVMTMLRVTEGLADGNFTERIGVSRNDELGQLAEGIDDLAARLEELEQARSRLIAAVSHELRTPLTIIRGHAFTLSREETDAVRSQRFTLIDAEAERLAKLIDDLLEAASHQVQPARLSIVAVSLKCVLTRAVDRHGEVAVAEGVRLHLDDAVDEVSVIADLGRVEQILDNLITNAIRHATPEGRVTISVTSDDGGEHSVRVSNTGDEVPLAERGRIFEMFEQGLERSGRIGLGLYISQLLAKAQGGSLFLDPHSASTTFVLTLPANVQAASGTSSQEVAELGRPTSLKPVRWIPSVEVQTQ